MQTIDKLQKQLLLGTEINAILKQSNRLLDIVKENQMTSRGVGNMILFISVLRSICFCSVSSVCILLLSVNC